MTNLGRLQCYKQYYKVLLLRLPILDCTSCRTGTHLTNFHSSNQCTVFSTILCTISKNFLPVLQHNKVSYPAIKRRPGGNSLTQIPKDSNHHHTALQSSCPSLWWATDTWIDQCKETHTTHFRLQGTLWRLPNVRPITENMSLNWCAC